MSKNTNHQEGKWFCIYCEEWHLNSQTCSVLEVRSYREDQYERMLND